MIENLRIRKKLTQLGITALAAVNGAMCLGCANVEAQENVQSLVSMSTVLTSDDKDEVTATNTPVITEDPTKVSTPNPTSSPVVTPEPTPYDPYTLTDEEAIEIGTYIYDNYVSRYRETEGLVASIWPDEYTKEDIINFVCVENQKYPALYPDRASSCSNGYLNRRTSFLEVLLDASVTESYREGKNKIFPYFMLLKEGREDRKLLKELDEEFAHLISDDVSADEVYQYWGKLIKFAINADETFKDWDSFTLPLFCYMAKTQYAYCVTRPEDFNYADFLHIPAKYVFDNKKDNVYLTIQDTFYYINTTTRGNFSGLTDQEYDAYIGCFDKIFVKYMEENIDSDNYIKKRIKNGN